MKKTIKFIICIILVFALFLTSITLFFPSPILSKTNYVEFYDKNDEIIKTEIYENKGQYIYLKELNPYTFQSFISIEDKNFYSHHGFDILRNIQALFINIFSLSIKQGASTISQQYARNTLLSIERTLSRKIKEAFYTIKIERKYSKDKILEGYLNSLYFGHGLTGIDAASNYYFNKSPSDLSIAESAILAGICNAPSIYSPNIDQERAKSRQKLVLYQMFTQNYITNIQYQQALKEELKYHFIKHDSSNIDYYKDAVINKLKSLNIYNKINLQKGLKIYTNIDSNLSESINSLLKKYKPQNTDTQTSIIIMEPFTNKILYLTGGFDYMESSYNRAISSSRQIGSTIKPLLYSLALANGFSPNTLLVSEETTFNIESIGLYSPKNPSNKYADTQIDMIQAIALSDNIYALKTLLLLGSKNLVDLLKQFEITEIDALPSIALGTISTSLLQLTAIYNTFASLGEYYKPSLIRKVTDSQDNTLFISPSHSIPLLDKTNTLILNQMLTSTFDSSLSSYLSATMANYKPYNIYAAKSGTTKNDSYVMSYNPNYTIGIWTGSDSNNNYNDHILSKHLFKDVTNILENTSAPSWYKPDFKTKALRYNPSTHEFNNSGKMYYFKK